MCTRNLTKFNELQMLRKTTSMNAATANKFVKKHVLEMIDVKNNGTNSEPRSHEMKQT